MDMAPSSGETSHEKVEQVVSVEMEVTHTKTADNGGETPPTAETLSSKEAVNTEGQSLLS